MSKKNLSKCKSSILALGFLTIFCLAESGCSSSGVFLKMEDEVTYQFIPNGTHWLKVELRDTYRIISLFSPDFRLMDQKKALNFPLKIKALGPDSIVVSYIKTVKIERTPLPPKWDCYPRDKLGNYTLIWDCLFAGGSGKTVYEIDSVMVDQATSSAKFFFQKKWVAEHFLKDIWIQNRSFIAFGDQDIGQSFSYYEYTFKSEEVLEKYLDQIFPN